MLKIGDKAPNFVAEDQFGKKHSLTDYKGKKLILYFYPKDLTPGCTLQACNLRDKFKELTSAGYVVLGVSADTQKKHVQFIEKHQLPFSLLADVDKKMVNLYGVWGQKKFMGRIFDGIHRKTFVIDENGIIQNIIDKVDTKNHAQQVLNK
ncbi:MAG: thioredoxin-dependent thiol peroxidase [Flavobacteriales bacterium]|nr:thioredoxin-dependent thiol peroxidase [Flavobacteriales bacterium]